MAFDEALFGRLHRWWSRRRGLRSAAHELAIEPEGARWSRLLWLLAGRELRLAFGDGPGRLGECVRLPVAVPSGGRPDDARAVVVLRLALAAAAEAAGVCSDRGGFADVLPRLLHGVQAEWPGVQELLPAAERYARATGRVAAGVDRHVALSAVLGPLPGPPQGAGPACGGGAPERAALPDGGERAKRKGGDVEVVEVDDRDDGANPLAHVFEKVRTAEEHTGGNRAMDGDDELDDHVEALEELDLRRVVRTRRAARSVFRADVDFAATGAELPFVAGGGDASVRYDEWDERSRRYLRDWCTVRVARGQPAEAAVAAAVVGPVRHEHRGAIVRLRAEFARLARARVVQNRQPVGSDLDIDAIVERHGDLRAAQVGRGVVGEARLFTARRPALRDVAVLLLLDRSLSSDSWVNGRRVLDTTREAVLVLGEALRDVRLPMAIGAFCSHARGDCRYDVVSEFGEEWRVAQQHLVALRPDGYTRVGPAVRHATALLERMPVRRRLLLVLSDCKPVDYDHYEGQRGIGDVRQAVREARRAGVETLALAIDRTAAPHLPLMFGARGFCVLPDAGRLAVVLARLHQRLLRA